MEENNGAPDWTTRIENIKRERKIEKEKWNEIEKFIAKKSKARK